MTTLNHPLPLHTKLLANKPNCPCKGGGHSTISGSILKIISNSSGTWYYLDSGSTIKDSWIIKILP